MKHVNATDRYCIRWGQGERTRSLLWDATRPLPLGYPARYVLEHTPGSEVRLRDLAAKQFGTPLQAVPAGREEWHRVALEGFSFEIKRVNPRPVANAATALQWEHVTQRDSFAKIVQATQGALAVLVLIAVGLSFLDKPAVTPQSELIPAQFAKVLMKAQPKPTEKKMAAAPSGGSAGEGETVGASVGKTPKARAENTAFVKAFRAKSLQSAVTGLLKGGMTSLLAAESQLLAGDSRHEAKRIFDGAAAGSGPASPDASAGNGKGVKVATLGGGGGGGIGGGVGAAVGYGSGKTAGIAGQGESFVSLDLPMAVEEGLTKEEVGKVIHAHISEIRYCYESSMIRNENTEGKLILDFTIGGSGAVKTAAIKESSLGDARLDDCILRRLMKWGFPKPNGGVDVAVSYPFLFKALKR